MKWAMLGLLLLGTAGLPAAALAGTSAAGHVQPAIYNPSGIVSVVPVDISGGFYVGPGTGYYYSPYGYYGQPYSGYYYSPPAYNYYVPPPNTYYYYAYPYGRYYRPYYGGNYYRWRTYGRDLDNWYHRERNEWREHHHN